MLARAALIMLALAVPAAVQAGGAQLVIGAAVAKRVQISLQGDRLEVRSNSREGVILNLGSTTIVVPGGVHVLRLPPGTATTITASPL